MVGYYGGGRVGCGCDVLTTWWWRCRCIVVFDQFVMVQMWCVVGWWVLIWLVMIMLVAMVVLLLLLVAAAKWDEECFVTDYLVNL